MIGKGYVNKSNLEVFQVIPVPQDLVNWIEVDYDPDKDYVGLVYDEVLADFVPNTLRAGRLRDSARKEAYVAESDSLYLEWQYDGNPASETIWRDKVAEIKARFPE